jgi:hypothetical protein
MRRTVLVFGICIAVMGGAIGAAYGLRLGPWSEGSVGPGPVIARVDGRPIYLNEAKARVAGLTTVHGEPDEGWQDIVLRSLVADAVLEAYAEREGLELTDAEVDAHIERIRGQFSDEDGFDAWLDSNDMTLEELTRRIRLQDLTVLVYESVTADIDITVDDIRDYYRENRSSFIGADGEAAPFLAVRHDIRETLTTNAKDDAYTAWLEDQRARAEVVVVMDDWWRSIT